MADFPAKNTRLAQGEVKDNGSSKGGKVEVLNPKPPKTPRMPRTSKAGKAKTPKTPKNKDCKQGDATKVEKRGRKKSKSNKESDLSELAEPKGIRKFFTNVVRSDEVLAVPLDRTQEGSDNSYKGGVTKTNEQDQSDHDDILSLSFHSVNSLPESIEEAFDPELTPTP